MSRVQQITKILGALRNSSGKLTQNEPVGLQFDRLCKEAFGVENGFEFIADFSALLAQVDEDIARVPGLTEVQRKVYLQQLDPLRSLFGSETFARPWSDLVHRLGQGPLLNSLLLMDPLLDPSRYKLRAVLDRDAIRTEMAELEEAVDASNLIDEVKRLLKFEITKMRIIIDNQKSFKETRIWEQYQKITAQLVAVVVELDEKERSRFRGSLFKLTGKVREALGLTADIAGLADVSIKLLGGGG